MSLKVYRNHFAFKRRLFLYCMSSRLYKQVLTFLKFRVSNFTLSTGMNRTTLVYNNLTYCWYDEIKSYSVCPDPSFKPKAYISEGKLFDDEGVVLCTAMKLRLQMAT